MRPEEVVEALFVETHVPLFRYVSSLLGPERMAETEDIIQHSFLKLFRNLLDGEHIREPRNWIFVAARNLAIDELRRRRRDFLFEDFAEKPYVADSENTPETVLLERESMAAVEQSIAGLPPQERACLRLRIRGFSYREIAQILEIEVNTVGPTLAHALAKLKVKR